jgi:hypothetical protein
VNQLKNSKRKYFGANRKYLNARIIELANLSPSKKTQAYLTRAQLMELVSFLSAVREKP